MKLRNLFLVGLAAMAMASCSNENDPIENGGNGEKNATVQFSLSFPTATMTKATEEGLSTEQEFTKLDFYIKYAGNTQKESFNKSDFEPNADGKTFTLKKTITANAENGVTYYVVMNPDKAGISSENPTFTETVDGGYTNSLDALLENIAKSNEFVMTGSATGNIIAGQVNDVKVNVSRVAAKLKEETPTTAFAVVNNSQAVTASDGAALNMKFEKYTFANLNTQANLFGNDPVTTSTYFQALTADGFASFANYNSKAIATPGNDINITYCMANAATTPTKVIYQATALWDTETEGKSFYVYEGTAYRTFEALNTAYTSADLSAYPISLSDASTAAEFAAFNIAKYQDGKCYYIQDIKTSGSIAKIDRNNVYKLKVKSVANWGIPEVVPVTPTIPTLLTLEVTQDEWTINVNEFEL